MVNDSPANAGDVRNVGLIPESGRSPVVGNSNPLQYSRLENPMDRGARRVIVLGVAESDTTERLSTMTRCNFSLALSLPPAKQL